MTRQRGGRRRPISNKVQSLLDEIKRRKGERDLNRRFLIVCEDDRSAPRYFETLKRHWQLAATKLTIVGSKGSTQPTQVVQRAQEMIQRASSEESGTVAFDEAWCLIDGDYGGAITNARTMAAANEINLAISTMCFEYWVLLHFCNCTEPLENCEAVGARLRRECANYDKGKYDFCEIMNEVNTACERARAIRQPGIARSEMPENQNPCTEVYLLVNALLNARV